MNSLKILIVLSGFIVILKAIGISPVHDSRARSDLKLLGRSLLANSPHKIMMQLDNSITKSTKNITNNKYMEATLYEIANELIKAIMIKLDVQDKITKIATEALEATVKDKVLSAIETRRILDYISATLANNMITITKASTSPEFYRLVHGLGRIAVETSIISALKDETFASALTKKQFFDSSLRKKRSVNEYNTSWSPSSTPPLATKAYNDVSSKPKLSKTSKSNNPVPHLINKTSTFNEDNRKKFHLNQFQISQFGPEIDNKVKSFLDKNYLDKENKEKFLNTSEVLYVETPINETHVLITELQKYEMQIPDMSNSIDEWVDANKNDNYKPDDNDIEVNQGEFFEKLLNRDRSTHKLERRELKAKYAILYAGDVAFTTAASIIAMRRALTASIEVQLAVKYAKMEMENHDVILMNLARTAAKQTEKEAKIASIKSTHCDRLIKQALKYTAQSKGASLNHIAKRIVMETVPLSSLAKSMAIVSSDIAVNSLYTATDAQK